MAVTASSGRRSPGRRLLLPSAILAGVMWLLTAAPVAACSCAGDLPMATWATPENAIFSGLAGPADARGVPVRVAEWFWGRDAQAVVYLARASFGDGAGCGTTAPRPGTSWIWITYLPGPGQDPVTGLCNPHAEIGTPEGTALLADVRAFFSGVAPPGGDPAVPTPGGETIATPAVATLRPESPADSSAAAAPILVATVGLGLAVLLGAVVLAGRRSRASG